MELLQPTTTPYKTHGPSERGLSPLLRPCNSLSSNHQILNPNIITQTYDLYLRHVRKPRNETHIHYLITLSFFLVFTLSINVPLYMYYITLTIKRQT